MRWFIYSCLFLLSLALPPAGTAMAQGASAGTEASQLDTLFAELKEEDNEAAARRIAERIRDEWQDAGGDTANLLMEWAQEAAQQEKYHVALDLLDQTVVLYPDYVEGWTRRALVHVMMQDFSRAMADLSRALTLEPRHFEAMSGVAGILRVTGHEDAALAIYRRMLEIYPMKRSAQRAVMTLVDEQTDDRI